MNELEDYLNGVAGSPADFNSCNAWGFGGGVGKVWTLADGRKVKIFTAYYRHQKSTRVITLRTPRGGFLFDEINTAKARRALLSLLQEGSNS